MINDASVSVQLAYIGRILFRAAGFLIVVAALATPIRAGDADCSTSVQVDVYDAYGQPRKGAKISLRSLTGETLTSIVAAKATFPDVPCDDYVLDVKSILGSAAISRMVVRASGGTVQVRVGLPVRFGDPVSEGGGFTLRVLLVGAGLDRTDLWARLAGVYLPLRVDFGVDKNGRFEAKGLEGGRYQIQVFRGSECLATEDVEIDLAGKDLVEVSIRLPTAAETQTHR